MFRSRVKEIMKAKKMTMREMAGKSGVSVVTLNKARQDEGIAECRLSTLARIGGALGVRTKRLYDETEGPPEERPAEGESPAGHSAEVDRPAPKEEKKMTNPVALWVKDLGSGVR
jgi:transcriptional regulator with XRE-family HTH domain